MGVAPGAPGSAPTWTAASKDTVITGLGPARVWAAVGRGVVNEVYWPSTGTPQVRLWTFFVRVGERWYDVANAADYELGYPRPGVLVPTIVHRGDGFELALEMVVDPIRDALVVRYDLRSGDQVGFEVIPSLGGSGGGDTAWVTADCVFATGRSRSLAVVAEGGFAAAGAGYVGVSDALASIATSGAPDWRFDRADDGVVATFGLLTEPRGALALGLSDRPGGARLLASSVLAEGAEEVVSRAVERWTRWAQGLRLVADSSGPLAELAYTSAAVLKVHEDATFPGAIVASLSLPWGTTHEDAGGYHLVWPRDAVQSAFALLAAGQVDDARRVLAYLIAAQTLDGHWLQNFFPNGTGFWTGLQLDETALPVLLAAALRQWGVAELAGTGSMVRRAVAFLTARGPMSPQDRWEENPGANAFTLATTIAALTAAAPWLDGPQAADAQDVADEWNERIESWTYVEDTPLAAQFGVPGYYVRLSPPVDDGGLTGDVEVRNRAGLKVPATGLVSMDFLALARYGVRSPDDPRMVGTVRVVDELLAAPTPAGIVYYRYNEDGYGEHSDGSPYDGTGVGRPWPLLVGERGHYALQRGEDTEPYLTTMAACAGAGGMLPEQVWDGAPHPDRGLAAGRPSGSAMPLAWAHAEYLRLFLAARAGTSFELLDVVARRYSGHPPAARAWTWRTMTPVIDLPAGRALRIESDQVFTLHVGFDGWTEISDRPAKEHLPGRWLVELAVDELDDHQSVQFTRLFPTGWEGMDHHVRLHHALGDRCLAPAANP